MVGKKKAFAFKHSLSFDSVDPASGLRRGWYWVVTNLSEDVYNCDTLRNILGIYPESYARQLENSPEIVVVNSIQELCRMGVCGEITCTLKAVNEAAIFAPFGKEHTTSFVYDLSKPLKDLAKDLLNAEMVVGPDRIPYKIIPGTIKMKKRKATTPHLG